MGSAIEEVRATQDAQAGSPWIAQVHGVLARRSPDEVPTLRELVASGYAPDPERAFGDRLTTVLAGITVRRGLPAEDVEKPSRPNTGDGPGSSTRG